MKKSRTGLNDHNIPRKITRGHYWTDCCCFSSPYRCDVRVTQKRSCSKKAQIGCTQATGKVVFEKRKVNYAAFTCSLSCPISVIWKVVLLTSVCSWAIRRTVETTWMLQRRCVVIYCSEHLNNTLISVSSICMTTTRKVNGSNMDCN